MAQLALASSFLHDGLSIAYEDTAPAGEAERTVVLIHGFASNLHEGWRRTGWINAFQRRRMRAVALDLRGHGGSAKPHDPALYGHKALASDVLALLDHLGLNRVDLFGYSMGAGVALAAALAAPDRISNLILGGFGRRMFDPQPDVGPNPMAQAMLAEDPESIVDRRLKNFRLFAQMQGEDRQALAASVQGPLFPVSERDLAAIAAPVLLVSGENDDRIGDIEGLARAFPDGRASRVAGCDHFSAIPHALTKAAVFDFLDGLDDAGPL